MWQFLHFLLLLVIPSEGVVNLLVDLDTPRGIALDLEGGRMYWAEDGTQRIRSATLEGENLKDVIVKTAVSWIGGFRDLIRFVRISGVFFLVSWDELKMRNHEQSDVLIPFWPCWVEHDNESSTSCT